MKQWRFGAAGRNVANTIGQRGVTERRTIREGLDCWREIGRAESYEHWKKIGAALSIGKQWALRTIDPEAPWYRQRYGARFSQWLQAHGFDAMRPSDRSHAITLFENRESVERWRQTLSDKQRSRLRGCQQNVKRWRKETWHGNGKCPADLKREAKAAWKRFVWCVRSLPAHDAAPLWQVALAEAAAYV
jgi:hypothetical protein